MTKEILGVLRRPELQRRLYRLSGLPEFEEILALMERAEQVEPEVVARVCRDPSDDKYFACAVAAGADYIVSEDEDILAITEYEGVKTVRAAVFLKLLDAAMR